MSQLLSELPSSLPGHGLLFLYAFLFALAEIEIEGPLGWAEALPTWFRVTPWYARLFSFVMAGKPLTGYHAVMLPLTFLSFHVGFAFGQPWSLATEALVLGRYFFWIIIWDVIWFIFNPPFGWSRFRPGQVWWLGKLWLGPFPQEYWSGAAFSFVLVALGHGTRSLVTVLFDHAVFCATLIALTLLCTLAVPLYQRWYQHMRREGSDERRLAIKREI